MGLAIGSAMGLVMRLLIGSHVDSPMPLPTSALARARMRLASILCSGARESAGVWANLVRRLAAGAIVALFTCVLAHPAAALAPSSAPAPHSFPAPSERMDSPEPSAEMEAYRHSSTVQSLARVLHVPVERAAVIFEDFNSGLLILVIGYFLAKYLPGAFRSRRQKIGKDLADARSATEIANQRLQAVEARLAHLDKDIAEIRDHAAHDSEGDQKRIEASLEAERARIIRSAAQEIAAAQAAAERELKRFAADLAVERAMSRIELSADADRVLVTDFTENLSTMLHPGDFPKGGQN